MVDLIVPAGTVVTISQPSQVEPRYAVFRMELNSKIVASIDLKITASRAEFGENCIIDASGAPGANGNNGANGPLGVTGGAGTDGLPGQNGRSVTIEAGLTKVGGLTIITDGGAGGRGGTGGAGGPRPPIPGQNPGAGGRGGWGAPGGDAGQISLTWTRLAPHLPLAQGASPQGHVYRSNGGFGGTGGAGGTGGTPVAAAGANGGNAPDGNSVPVQITWRTSMAALLWVQKQDIGPAPRAYHDMAFDPLRGRLVLFGGLGDGKVTGDTWEWDGRFWVQVADTGPTPRAYHGMAYDPAGKRVLLFGGRDRSEPPWMGDTWGWDGQDWVQLADTGPSARAQHAMTCDPSRGRVVLFSGGQTAPLASDTWEWAGDWVQVADTGPTARLGAKLASVNDGVLLFGGIGADEAAPRDTWSWDGHQWKQVADTGPAPRAGHAMASDGTVAVLFGGRLLVPSPGPANDTWTWHDQNWRQIQDIGPSPREGHAMAGVAANYGDQVTLYGGQASQALLGDTWRLEDRS